MNYLMETALQPPWCVYVCMYVLLYLKITSSEGLSNLPKVTDDTKGLANNR